MYDEAMVKRIIERAIELDAAGSAMMTRQDILAIATELGISRSAVDQALAESAVPTRASTSLVAGPLSTLKLLAVTTALGATSGVLVSAGAHAFITGSDGIAGISMAVTLIDAAFIMLSGALAVLPGTRHVRSFLERNFGVWLGAAFGGTVALELFAVVPGFSAIQPLASYGIKLLVTSLAGGCVVAYRTRSKSKDADSASTDGTAQATMSMRDRVIRVVRRWLDRLSSIPPLFRELAVTRNAAKSRP